MPHHGVFKKDGGKIHVVFDASCKLQSNLSLNDVLLVGPKIQDDLFDILVHFPQYCYIITADVEMMFCQIVVAENDRPYQRILWHEDISQLIQEYELATVTYGTAFAPFLAQRSLFELANSIEAHCPCTAKVLHTDFTMDDLVSGVDTLQEATELKLQLTQATDNCGFTLRKWMSNHPDIAPSGDNTKAFKEDKSSRLLGIHWCCLDDELTYMQRFPTRDAVSKLLIISEISQVFDPVGLIVPVTIGAKILIQELWKQAIDWDLPVPKSTARTYAELRADLKQISEICTMRSLYLYKGISELHVFADALQNAYAAVMYAPVVSSNDTFTTIICAKSKVALIKPVSITRLELCGAVLATKLIAQVATILSIETKRCFAYTDSKVVLAWLAKPPHNWKTFVANRVALI